MPCICGLPPEFDRCCGPFLEGTDWPETAEQLMRSRYAAYVRGEVDYLLETHDPSTRDGTDRVSIEQWSKSAQWDGLEVQSTTAGQAGDDQGRSNSSLDIELLDRRWSITSGPRSAN
jgi:SEC-C motif-containing protein